MEAKFHEFHEIPSIPKSVSFQLPINRKTYVVHICTNKLHNYNISNKILRRNFPHFRFVDSMRFYFSSLQYLYLSLCAYFTSIIEVNGAV